MWTGFDTASVLWYAWLLKSQLQGTEFTGIHIFIMSTPLGGGHIIFAFSAVRRPTWFPDILGNSSYPIFTKFGMQVYWVNSLYGIAFGDDSSIAN